MEPKEAKKIKKKYEQIKETLKLKDELLSAITHELRTSLSLIQGPVTTLQGFDHENSSEKRQTVTNLAQNVNQLNKIIDQLDDIGHLGGQQNHLQVTEIELCSFLHRCVAFFESKAQQNNISLNTDLPAYEIVQTLDPYKLEKTIIILLSNALKFTPQNGSVKISLKNCDESIEISVKDTGQGMTKEVLDRIFLDSLGVPESSEKKDYTDRMGIRLSIAKRYTELHEGTIQIDSEKGKGTTVKVMFPKEAKSIKRATVIDLHTQKGETISLEEETIDLAPLYSQSDDTDATILVVDDNRNMREYMVTLISKMGIKVEVASNGLDALKQLTMIKPHLIISDIMMPEMDGFEFVKKIRTNSKYHLTPVILISAKAEEEARIYGYQIGISDYLVKPFSESELKARVLNLLRRRKERDKYLNDSEDNVSYEEPLIENLKDYIHDRIKNESITINELSQNVNLSRRQLYRDLKAVTGFTPAEFVREVKLRKAMELFENNRKITVAEVAQQVGYNTTAHFSKIFKKRFGRNPSKY